MLPNEYYDLIKDICRLGLHSREPLDVGGRKIAPYDVSVAFLLKERERILKETEFGPQRGCVSIIVNGMRNKEYREYRFHRDIMEGFPSIQGYGLGSVLPWIYKTGGGPQLSGKDDIAHVLYWKNERPELYRETDKFLGSKDYLNLKLTGRSAASCPPLNHPSMCWARFFPGRPTP